MASLGLDHLNPELRRRWPRRVLGSLGAVVLAAGGVFAFRDFVDNSSTCGGSIVLNNSDPEGYMDIGDKTFALDVENQVGEMVVSVRKGGAFYEQQRSTPTFIPLEESKEGDYTGFSELPDVETKLFITLNSERTVLRADCR